jgi:hypothetical protein
MPIGKVPPETFLTHKGVSIFRCYARNRIELPERYVFTTDQEITDSREICPAIFDVRKFVDLQALAPPLLAQEEARRLGMELTTFQLTPAYLEMKSAWQVWWDTDEPNLISAAIILAIEEGKLPR